MKSQANQTDIFSTYDYANLEDQDISTFYEQEKQPYSNSHKPYVSYCLQNQQYDQENSTGKLNYESYLEDIQSRNLNIKNNDQFEEQSQQISNIEHDQICQDYRNNLNSFLNLEQKDKLNSEYSQQQEDSISIKNYNNNIDSSYQQQQTSNFLNIQQLDPQFTIQRLLQIESNQILQSEQSNIEQISNQVVSDCSINENNNQQRNPVIKQHNIKKPTNQTYQNHADNKDDTKNLLRNYGQKLAVLIRENQQNNENHKWIYQIVDQYSLKNKIENPKEFKDIFYERYSHFRFLNFKEVREEWMVSSNDPYRHLKMVYKEVCYKFFSRYHLNYIYKETNKINKKNQRFTHLKYLQVFLKGLIQPNTFVKFKQPKD